MREKVFPFFAPVVLALLVFLPAKALTLQGGLPVELRQAQSLLQSKDFDGAIKILEDFTRSNPSHAFAWMMMGRAYHLKGDVDKALAAHLKAAEFPQNRPTALYNAACAYALKGNKEEAFKLLSQVRQSGNFDMSLAAGDSDLNSLVEDPRFEKLMPKPEDFLDPFVEKVKIIHELAGEAKGDQFGWIARNIGDTDGDRINDLTTSAPLYKVNNIPAGRVYVYSGKSGKLLWTQTGQPGDTLGLGIEAAGDTNRDGVPDVIAGAPGAGKAYVYSGKDGKILLTLGTGDKSEAFGRKVSDTGDLNGDGHGDIMVGAPGNSTAGKGAGRAYIFSGKDGSILLTLDGEKAGDGFGSSVAGFKDRRHAFLIVGAPNAGPNNRGRVYAYAGLAREPKFIIESDETGAQLGGMFVSVVGDVNRDKVPDVYASDFLNSAKGASTGRIYIHSGADGKRLLTLTGEAAGDGFGIGPADAGDVNGDGHDDLIIGAWQHRGAAISGGKVYLYSGKDGGLLQTYTCRIPGDTFGFDATGMGDVDGDGASDFLLTSAWSGIKGFRSGRMFIVSGRTAGGIR